MKKRKIIMITVDCFAILGLYSLFFGLTMNPIQEFKLLKNGTIKEGLVERIEGGNSNMNESLLSNPYHYSFTIDKGEIVKASQLVFISLKDQPETAKPKFSASITYLEDNPDINSFTSTIASSFTDFIFRRIGLGLLFVCLIYVPFRFIILAQFKESQVKNERSLFT
ncbi:hypothetical protein ACQKCH_14765 [Nubsella zeaxanthinifaciens]|uniref:hypothetical protein n=1 Tax=Nubsella zeaxanthinifaciens TaxID=392412 RepID=UPI003D00C271